MHSNLSEAHPGGGLRGCTPPPLGKFLNMSCYSWMMKKKAYWVKDISFTKSLGNEVSIWKTLWQSTDRELPKKPFTNSNWWLRWRCFPYIHRPLVICSTLPITSAEAERSFSLMKRIKTCSRSTMSEDTCWKAIIWSRSYRHAVVEVDEIWIVPQIPLKSKWKDRHI